MIGYQERTYGARAPEASGCTDGTSRPKSEVCGPPPAQGPSDERVEGYSFLPPNGLTILPFFCSAMTDLSAAAVPPDRYDFRSSLNM